MPIGSFSTELCFHFGSARTVRSGDVCLLLGFSLYLLFIFRFRGTSLEGYSLHDGLCNIIHIYSLLYIQVSQVESLYSLCPHDGGQYAAGLYAQLAG